MLEIEEATVSALVEISKIHRKVYSSSHFTSFFSLDLTGKYYSYFIDGDSKIFIVVDKDNAGKREVCGFLVCGTNIADKIKMFKDKERVAIFKTVLKHPFAAFKAIINKLYLKVIDDSIKYKEADFLILSIASSVPNKGVGTILLEYCCQYILDKKYSRIGLYVRVNNISALNVYLKNNYEIVGYISGQYYMELKIKGSASSKY